MVSTVTSKSASIRQWSYRNLVFLDTLAACYAATGQFNKACATAQKAINFEEKA